MFRVLGATVGTLLLLTMVMPGCRDQHRLLEADGGETLSRPGESFWDSQGVSMPSLRGPRSLSRSQGWPDSIGQTEGALDPSRDGAEDSALCRRPGPGCEIFVLVQVPLGTSFEIRRDPLGPLELRASLEFFADSSCWRTMVMTSADIRAGVPQSCPEIALGAINVGDGSRILIKEGSYYVRVRGIDGAPYTHLIWEQERGQPARELRIISLEADYGTAGSAP